ncbi:CGNR zinc finger domain-containing protein [Amycolatopsis sp. NPDC058986]|uniref:CGNR zinc finger domain-containing protein n=1 Tax=unclassified Amycolatopsis TaxID=2618356 RepID=UPI003670306B
MAFEFLSGDVALDFVATVGERTTRRTETLSGTADLAAWLKQARLVDTPVQVTDADLAEAKELREALYEYLVALTAGARLPAAAVKVINARAAQPTPVVRLTRGGTPVLEGTVRAALSSLARSGIRLAGAGTASAIRWCADDTCTRPFLDRSRGHRRRWCGMSGCGDRAKAAAYRRRRREAADH